MAEQKMSAADFTAALDALGWAPTEAARVLNLSRSAIQKFKAGDRVVSGPVVPLLLLHLEREQRLRFLLPPGLR